MDELSNIPNHMQPFVICHEFGLPSFTLPCNTDLANAYQCCQTLKCKIYLTPQDAELLPCPITQYSKKIRRRYGFETIDLI